LYVLIIKTNGDENIRGGWRDFSISDKMELANSRNHFCRDYNYMHRSFRIYVFRLRSGLSEKQTEMILCVATKHHQYINIHIYISQIV
jgi:hypothetical protein